MEKKLRNSFFICCAVFIIAACGDTKIETKADHLVFDEYKPSPLADLMRTVANDFTKVHDALSADSNEIIKLGDYSRMKFAEPTSDKKADVETDVFKQMTEAFLFTVDEFNNSATDRKKIFNAAVANCTNCHSQLCPGPLMRIKKLPVK